MRADLIDMIRLLPPTAPYSVPNIWFIQPASDQTVTGELLHQLKKTQQFNRLLIRRHPLESS